jgi:DNA primase
MVRKQGEAVFAEHIESAVPLSEFFFERLTADIDLGSLDGRAKFVEKARPFIETLPEGGFRDMMIAQLESRSFHKISKPVPSPVIRSRYNDERGKPVQTRTPLRVAMAHLVQNPALVEQLQNIEELAAPGNADIQGIEIFRELVDFCRKRPNISTAQLIELWHGHPALPHLEKLAVWHLPGEEENQLQEFIDAVNRIRLSWVEILLSRISNIMLQREEYRALQHRQQALKQQLEGQHK